MPHGRLQIAVTTVTSTKHSLTEKQIFNNYAKLLIFIEFYHQDGASEFFSK